MKPAECGSAPLLILLIVTANIKLVSVPAININYNWQNNRYSLDPFGFC